MNLPQLAREHPILCKALPRLQRDSHWLITFPFPGLGLACQNEQNIRDHVLETIPGKLTVVLDLVFVLLSLHYHFPASDFVVFAFEVIGRRRQ